tara:strand:- start:1848 stop:2423 length:576 start_codon:yes stop_codon:yes gene_type:complete
LAFYWLFIGNNDMNNKAIGFGDINAKLIFYIKNRPPLALYQNLSTVKPLASNEIAYICHETGNHWRKIFNVYAKLLFELCPEQFSSWQQLRDKALLQTDSNHCLLFSPPELCTLGLSTANTLARQDNKKLQVILGKGYSEHLGLSSNCTWLSHDFAINTELGIIICPYFDYRQLSNKKISQLSGLIKQLTS